MFWGGKSQSKKNCSALSCRRVHSIERNFLCKIVRYTEINTCPLARKVPGDSLSFSVHVPSRWNVFYADSDRQVIETFVVMSVKLEMLEMTALVCHAGYGGFSVLRPCNDLHLTQN